MIRITRSTELIFNNYKLHSKNGSHKCQSQKQSHSRIIVEIKFKHHLLCSKGFAPPNHHSAFRKLLRRHFSHFELLLNGGIHAFCELALEPNGVNVRALTKAPQALCDVSFYKRASQSDALFCTFFIKGHYLLSAKLTGFQSKSSTKKLCSEFHFTLIDDVVKKSKKTSLFCHRKPGLQQKRITKLKFA